MGFVQHDDGVLAQLRIDQTLPQQHTVRHVLDHSLGTGAVLKTDGVAHLEDRSVLVRLKLQRGARRAAVPRGPKAHLLSQTAAVLLRDPLGHRHSSHTTGLRAADLPPGGVTGLRQVLSDLCGFPRSRLSDHNQDLVIVNSLQQVNMVNISDGKRAAFLTWKEMTIITVSVGGVSYSPPWIAT